MKKVYRWCPEGGREVHDAYSRKRERCPGCNKRLLLRVFDCHAWGTGRNFMVGKYGNHVEGRGACIHFERPPHKTHKKVA